MARPAWIRRIAIGIAAGLLAVSLGYLVLRFDWRGAFAIVGGADIARFVALVVLAHIGYLVVRTWRWLIVLQQSNAAVAFKDLYWISAVTVSLAALTPGQVGEAFKIELLKRRGLLGRWPALGGFAVERVLDLLAIAGMGIIGFFAGSGLVRRYPALIGIAIGLVAVCLGLLVWLAGGARGAAVQAWSDRIRSGAGTPGTWLRMGAVTVLGWVFVLAGWQVSMASVGIHLSWAQMLWLIAVVTLGTLASMLPGGLGFAEVVTAEALIGMGIPAESAYAGSIMMRLYAIVIVLVGVLHLLGGQLARAGSTTR